MKKTLFYLSLIFFVFSCKNIENPGKKLSSGKSIKILNWNLETFFDGEFDGNEYKEFSCESYGWNKEKYIQRLERLAKVIKQSDADIVIMQEVEKKEQLHDIYNRLDFNFNPSKNYNYGCFTKNDDSSIGLALISRIPVLNASIHNIDVKTESSAQPSLRPIFRVNFNIEGKNFAILVNHWKSKSGGQEKTEIWRNYQEKTLSKLFSQCRQEGFEVFACGDFNKDIREFCKIEDALSKTNIKLKGKGGIDFDVYSPWFLQDGSLFETGSYWYNGGWERIDHFFAGTNILITDFKVENNGEWAGENGKPLRYYMKNGSGYSDHFPISCQIVL